MRFVAIVWFASVSGCVALSHEQLIEEDTDGDGIADADEWLELVGAGRQHFSSVAFADLDGDGLDDLLLANRENSDEWGRPFRGGSVFIVYGRTVRPDSPFELAHADAELIGPENELGDFRFAVGDYDCDGIDDVALGNSGSVGSRLFVLYGRPERFSGRPFIEIVAPALTPVLGYPRPAGDLDADGCDEFLVSRDERTTVIVRGTSARRVDGPLPVDAEFTPTDATHFIGVASAGDVDGDGFRDVIVGEERIRDTSFRAHVFYGPIDWRSQSLDEADAGIAIDDGDWASLRSGLDLDADGRDEVFVSSMYPNVDGETFLVFGRSPRLLGVHEIADLESVAMPRTDRLYSIGLSPSVGDADGDGALDLLLGAPMFEDERGPIGRVYRYNGPIARNTASSANEVWDGRVVAFTGSGALARAGGTYAERLGTEVAQDGDFDGDGFDDALMSAPSNVSPYGGRHVRLVWGAARSMR